MENNSKGFRALERVCPYHEDRGSVISEQGERIAAAEVEIMHMKEAYSAFTERFDTAAKEQNKALKDLCAEIKTMKLAVQTAETKWGSKGPSLLESEPIGWLNMALKKIFTHPAFWILFGWFLIKTIIFGEYPVFIQKDRPYVTKSIERVIEQPINSGADKNAR